MLISVILCTVGREQQLENFLDSLQQQRFQDYEIIIIDQNTDARVERLCNKLQFCAPLIIKKMQPPRLAQARNEGIGVSRGEYLFFPDDDSELPPCFFDMVKSLVAKYPNADVIAGGTKDADNRMSVCKFGDKPHVVTFSNIWYSMTAAATLFKRQVFSNNNVFDESFGYNARYKSAEDIELGLRLLVQKMNIYFDSSFYIYHPSTIPQWNNDVIKKMEWHGEGLGAAIRKHISMSNSVYLLSFFIGRTARAFAGYLSCFFVNRNMARAYLGSLKGRLRGFLCYRGTNA